MVLVSDAAAAHLNLLRENTYRTTWLVAKLLSKDRFIARDAATSLVRHLATTRPSNRTSFEEHLISQEELMRSLEKFSEADPPVLLWHDSGKYENLFKFVAPRFLLSPDHILDAERIHGRWQWACDRRPLKLRGAKINWGLASGSLWKACMNQHKFNRGQLVPRCSKNLIPT